MVNFFRKIRKQFADDNKLLKYLKYAFGEIILVVIGILIALSASEWNNNRKNQQLVNKALTEIYNQLQSDHDALEKFLANTKFGIKRISHLDSLLKKEPPSYSKSLDSLFGSVYGFRFFQYEKANYEDLKSNGLNLIKNDSIRKQLILVYESEFEKNEKNYNTEIWVNDLLRPYYMENFKDLNFTHSATPIDYHSLWNKTYYKNIVNYRLIFMNRVIHESNLKLKLEMEKLMKMIEQHIN